jgi:hypothetical protein
MNRCKKLLMAPVIAVVVVLFAAGPASAGQGGNPTEASCGLGKSTAHSAIQDQTSPGATEASHVKPSDVGCTGNAS